MIFCVTFMQYHPLVDNWIEIEASDKESARQAAFHVLKDKWSFIYPKEEFKSKYCPNGKVGKTVIADDF